MTAPRDSEVLTLEVRWRNLYYLAQVSWTILWDHHQKHSLCRWTDKSQASTSGLGKHLPLLSILSNGSPPKLISPKPNLLPMMVTGKWSSVLISTRELYHLIFSPILIRKGEWESGWLGNQHQFTTMYMSPSFHTWRQQVKAILRLHSGRLAWAVFSTCTLCAWRVHGEFFTQSQAKSSVLSVSQQMSMLLLSN